MCKENNRIEVAGFILILAYVSFHILSLVLVPASLIAMALTFASDSYNLQKMLVYLLIGLVSILVSLLVRYAYKRLTGTDIYNKEAV